MRQELQKRAGTRSAASAPAHRHPRRALAVRMLAARVAWLDGRLRWQDDQVVWEGPEKNNVFAPGPADLAQAERCLREIERYPHAAREALGDAEAWLREKRASLQRAKRLRPLRASDPEGAASLVSLLPAEALCANALPAPPSRMLLRSAAPIGMVEEPLRVLADDALWPLPVRALAALALGAIHRRRAESARGVPPSPPFEVSGVCRRAYRWGRAHGLPDEPALTAALLAAETGEDGEDRGADLALRCERAMRAAPTVGLPPALLRELLADGIAACEVVAVTEAVAGAEPLALRLLSRRHELPDVPPHPRGAASQKRRTVAEHLRAQRRGVVKALAALVRDYARSTGGDPAAVEAIARFTGDLLDLGPVSTPLTEVLLSALGAGRDLAPALQRDYLVLLAERHARIWDRETLPRDETGACPPRPFGDWLRRCWEKQGAPVVTLLRIAGDGALVREALELNLHRLPVSPASDWDADRLRLLVRLSRRFAAAHHLDMAWALYHLIRPFRSGRAAESALRPLVPLLRFTAEDSGAVALVPELLRCLSGQLPETGPARGEAIARLAPCLPQLFRFAARHRDAEHLCRPAVAGVVALGNRPDAAAWLDWYLCLLGELPCEQMRRAAFAAALGAALAGGDFARFQGVVQAALRYPIEDEEQEIIERGLAALDRFPGLRAPLAHFFAAAPRRSLALLRRIGTAARLGADALAPLDECRFDDSGAEGICHADDPSWQALLNLAPDLGQIAGAYWYARWLLGDDRPDLPPGVRRALEQPARWEAEREYLEEQIAREPGRADLRARRESLRARLADGERVRATLGAEVRERLAQVTAEAEMAAAEQQVLTCFRERLARMAGPLSGPVALDADRENALVLAANIEENRRLLLRLLRASVRGDRDWHARHPANTAFLEGLAASGVDVAAWLGAFPRRVRCLGAPGDGAPRGGWVRLHLETDPLRILPMGSYFDTCLSMEGGCNAFSTVSNACELNKRVLYATNAAGRVIGRKLIGITEEKALIGFHTYAALPDEAGNAALRAIIRDYLVAFARRCRLPLADAGTVPTLFAQNWYDDGAVAWEGESHAKTPGRPSTGVLLAAP